MHYKTFGWRFKDISASRFTQHLLKSLCARKYSFKQFDDCLFRLLLVPDIQLHASYLLAFMSTSLRYFKCTVPILVTEICYDGPCILFKHWDWRTTIYPFTMWSRSKIAAAYDISNTGISTCFLIYVTAWSTFTIASLSPLSFFFFSFWMHSPLNPLPDNSSFHRLCKYVWVRQKIETYILMSFILCTLLLVLFFLSYIHLLPFYVFLTIHCRSVPTTEWWKTYFFVIWD